MSSVEICFEGIQPFPIDKEHIQKYINNLIINELKNGGEITIIFCSDDYLLRMNKQYLDHDYYTDIITFDYVEGNLISGDLFISFERLNENSQQRENKLINEMYRVIFHGILHLIGYNDKTEKEQMLMTKMENYYLSEVDFSGIEL